MRCSGNAAQFSATNGPFARGDDSCNTRANTSLPEPVGPTSNAVTSVCATRWANANRCWLAGSTNTAARGLLARLGLFFSRAAARSAWRRLRRSTPTFHEAGVQSSAATTCNAPSDIASTVNAKLRRSTRQTTGTLKPMVLISSLTSLYKSALSSKRTTTNWACVRAVRRSARIVMVSGFKPDCSRRAQSSSFRARMGSSQTAW